MPLYEYQCQKCSQVHERMQKFSDAPLTECPECGGEVKKLVSLSSFSLKGSGWYSTDYKKSPAPASSASGTSDTPVKAPETTPEKSPEKQKEATTST